jgi:hypothetical protein
MEAGTEVVEVRTQTNEKVSCVASLMKQVVQLAESESALVELDLEVLRAIARGAQNILLAEKAPAKGGFVEPRPSRPKVGSLLVNLF